MKKTKIIIEIEEEKLSAINLYSKESDSDLNNVIKEAIEGHYKAVVPEAVRFYLESRQNIKISRATKKESPEIPKFADKKGR